MSRKQTCVIFNPAAGKHRAERRLARLEGDWKTHAKFWPTSRAGEAVELAKKAASAGFSVVAAAGGDGTVHEVANGLLAAKRPDVLFGILPLGSANDYAHSLAREFRGRETGDAVAVDVGLIRDASGRMRYFLGCAGIGFNGLVTIESRKIARLQGIALYTLATLRALRSAEPAEETLAFDNEPPHSQPATMLSVLLGRREGHFVMAPDARLCDGLFDYLLVGNMSRWAMLRFLPRVACCGPPRKHPQITRGRCRRLTIDSDRPLAVHTDGELFCSPDDGLVHFEIELLPRALNIRRPLIASTSALTTG